jgi:hypothetical protein
MNTQLKMALLVVTTQMAICTLLIVWAIVA